jgi:hypothetical protein
MFSATYKQECVMSFQQPAQLSDGEKISVIREVFGKSPAELAEIEDKTGKEMQILAERREKAHREVGTPNVPGLKEQRLALTHLLATEIRFARQDEAAGLERDVDLHEIARVRTPARPAPGSTPKLVV